MRNKSRHPTELKIRESESGSTVRIKRISPIVAEKRLGVQYLLDGKWKEEYKHWKCYSKNFADQISKARLDRIGGYHAYSTLWCSKFQYSCPVLRWNESQLSKVQKTIIGKSLSAAGYNSKMSRAVVFGPSQFGGIEWESALGILIYEQLKMLIGSLRLGDKVGKLLMIQLTWLQLIAGIETPILEETKQLQFLPKVWLTKLREKLRKLNITIELGQCWKPEKQRENDYCIMEYVMRYLPERMWNSINLCRLYLQAVTMADITTFDGTVIPKTVCEVQKPYRQSRLKFPVPIRPSKEDRKPWQYFIRHRTNKKLVLHTPLGRHPGVDVALAISSKQKILPWVKLKMVKVKSHIPIEEAQNQFHWEVNDLADKLATTVRQKVENQEERAALPILLEGSIVGCRVEGILCGNEMKKKVREQIGTVDLINYLCYKYLWTKEIFSSIDWLAHGVALNRIPQVNRITVTNIIHGWTATKQRRCREGGTYSPACQLCGKVEDAHHIWTCKDEKFKQHRRKKTQ